MAEENGQNITTQDHEKSEVLMLAEEFSSFFKVDTSKQVNDVESSIDDILAKLEEFCTIVEMIRSESKDVLFTTLPVLHQRCSEFEALFKKIDQLEDFMVVVKDCVEDSEEKVRIAEKELASKNIKKFLNSVPVPKFLSRKKELQPYLKKGVSSEDYQAPKNFTTDDYFRTYETANSTLS